MEPVDEFGPEDTTRVSSEGNTGDPNPLLAFIDPTQLVEDPYELPCVSAEDSELLGYKSLHVTVSEPEKASTLSFLVSTDPIGWNARRSFEDFVWLRNLLVSTYPGTYIAPALPKRIKNNKETNILKHQRFAQRFLHSVVNHPWLMRSPIVVGFLKAEEKEAYEIFKKQYSKSKKLENIEDFITLDGVARCDPNRNVSITKKVTDFFETSFQLNRQLKRNFEKLENNIRDTVDSLQKISETLKQLERLQEMVPENQLGKQVLNTFEGLISAWAQNEQEKIGDVKDYMSSLFKYSYKEVGPMIDLIKEKENSYKVYSKANNQLYTRKEKLFLKGDVNKWEINQRDSYIDPEELKKNKELALSKMLFNDTLKIKRLKDVHAHLNYRLFEEVKWMLKHMALRNIDNFKDLCVRQESTSNRNHLAWTEFLEKFNQLATN